MEDKKKFSWKKIDRNTVWKAFVLLFSLIGAAASVCSLGMTCGWFG